jgi:hypothetical protein
MEAVIHEAIKQEGKIRYDLQQIWNERAKVER